MTYEILPELVQDSPEWHEARRSSIGASEVAAILGLSPWQTPLDVYKAKMGVPNDIPEDLAYFGHAMEPVIAQWIRDRHPEVGPVNPGFAARSTEWPWLTASPDRTADDVGLRIPIELKTSGAFGRDKWSDGVPDFYTVQVQTQMAVIGAPYGWLAVLHGGNAPELFRIERDEAVIEQIVRLTEEWWVTYVVAQMPPEPVTSSEAVDLWPGDPELAVEGSESLYELWGAYGLMQAELVELTQQLDQTKLTLQKAMEDATTLTYEGRELFTWKPRAGARRFDQTTFKKDHPDLAIEYTKQGEPTRAFLRKTVKEVNA